MYETTHRLFEGASACSDDLKLNQRRIRNSKPLVNQLPREILSYIMLIGVDHDRRVWRWDSPKIGFQQVASYVCSYWREVATACPMLWTFIHIVSATRNEYTALYIARAGPTTLLDILIDSRRFFSPLYDGNSPEVDIQSLSNILQFLTACGAGLNRWRTLLLRCLGAEILPPFISFLNNSSASYLQLLRFECSDGSNYGDSSSDVIHFTKALGDLSQGSDGSHTLTTSSLSSLCDLELVSVPWPLCAKLTAPLHALHTLSITSSTPYSIELANMLMSNPHLVTLYLKSDNQHDDHSEPNKLNIIQPIVLPRLRSLHIHAKSGVTWALRMLLTIRAPTLDHLAIKYYDPFASSWGRGRLVNYLAFGGSSLEHPYTSCSASQPAYPTIQSLDISQFPCRRNELLALLNSFPCLVHLTLRRKQAEWLSEAPWMLPKLESLTAPQWTAESAINTILRTRAQGDTPIRLARFRKGYRKLVSTQTEGSSADNRPKGISEYEYYAYDQSPEARGDWQSIRGRLGPLTNGLDVPIEYDDRNEDYNSEGYSSDDYDDRFHTSDSDGYIIGNE